MHSSSKPLRIQPGKLQLSHEMNKSIIYIHYELSGFKQIQLKIKHTSIRPGMYSKIMLSSDSLLTCNQTRLTRSPICLGALGIATWRSVPPYQLQLLSAHRYTCLESSMQSLALTWCIIIRKFIDKMVSIHNLQSSVLIWLNLRKYFCSGRFVALAACAQNATCCTSIAGTALLSSGLHHNTTWTVVHTPKWSNLLRLPYDIKYTLVSSSKRT